MMPARDEGYVYIHDDPRTWPIFRPLFIAHDVGRTRDRSTAVVGGNSPLPPRLLGITDLRELPQGLCGSPRASALAAVDRAYGKNALIVADLSNDASYAEVLHQTFGRRVIGLQISRHGEGLQAEQRPVGTGSMPVYTIGRSHLLELFHSECQSDIVKMVDGPMARRAFQQLAELETELRDSGTVYRCPSGKQDDLGISCAMLAWAGRHPHLPFWIRTGAPRRPPKPARTTAGRPLLEQCRRNRGPRRRMVHLCLQPSTRGDAVNLLLDGTRRARTPSTGATLRTAGKQKKSAPQPARQIAKDHSFSVLSQLSPDIEARSSLS